MENINILFVCMGNICRSPLAEGALRNRVEQDNLADAFFIDSAGTHAYHVTEPPDPRSQQVAMSRGYDISDQRSRIVEMIDFELFDHILVMDEQNYATLITVCPKLYHEKIRYLLDFLPDMASNNVPDPYYGGYNGFVRTLDLIEEGIDAFYQDLQRG